MKKASECPQWVMLRGCQVKGAGKRAVISSTVNLVKPTLKCSSVRSRFWGTMKSFFRTIIHLNHRALTFLQESLINSVTQPANSPDLSPIEDLCWKLKIMIHDKTPSCKADLSSAIWDTWNLIDDFLLVKSMPQRTRALRKASGGTAKH